jgi:beta-glucosidase
MYVKGQPLFAFGHGLSYTTFDYANLRLSAPTVDPHGKVLVSIDIRNTGPRAGDEVPQLYVHQKASPVKRPAKELRGFARVPLQPGVSRTFTFALPADKLAWYDITRHAFTVSPGEYDVMVGASSDQAQATTTLTVTE